MSEQDIERSLYPSEESIEIKDRRCQSALQDVQKGHQLTHPPQARQDAPLPKRGRSEAHAATNKEQHVCARRRVGEPAVS